MGRRKKIVELPDYKITDVLNLEEIYIIINYVQVQNESCSFTASNIDQDTISNILKDLEIEHVLEVTENGIKFALSPPPKREYKDEYFMFEEYTDELPDDNDCFGG